jgi:quercetin dioxygenase-like cupin family protein
MHTNGLSLSDVMTGRVVAPGDRDWDVARQAFNLLVDQRPAAVAFPVDERDVIAAVRYAREHGLRVAPQATGHNAGPLGSLDDTLLVHVSQLGHVSIDAAARRVRVGAGVKWEKVSPRLSPLGLAALHGSSPDVGIAGYSLGGGMGWLARKYGLQANSVTAIELVTAEGHLLRTDATHEPELFWALRGGGGNFGVVTAIEFGVYPVRELYAGAMFFDFESASEVLHAWTEQLPAFPDEMMSWASLLQLPDAPDVPETMRGRAFAVVFGAFVGTEADGRGLLAPVRELGPEIDTFAIVPPVALGELAMDPPNPLPTLSAHHLLGDLPAAGVDELIAAAGPGSGSPLTMVQLRHMGAALAREPAGAGARATLPGTLSLFALGIVPSEQSRPAIESSLATVHEAMRPYRVGDYPNFIEDPTDASGFFDADTWRRLREVKALYDPRDIFKGNHHVPPATPEHSALVRAAEEVRRTPSVVLFEGRPDGAELSVYVTTFERGKGPRLHRHPYPEVFLVEQGRAYFDAGGARREVDAGNFVLVPAETPHRYENAGPGPLEVVSVHPSGVVVQTDL